MGGIDQIRVIRAEIDKAADTILDATMEALGHAGELGASPAAAKLEAALHRILEACAFHDLVSQRFDLIEGGASLDPLLNGPAGPGAGLDQAMADQLFDGAARPR